MIFKILGGLIFAWGALDLGMSYAGTDVWSQWLGIDLFSISEILWKYIAWIFMAVGGFIWTLGSRDEFSDADADSDQTS